VWIAVGGVTIMIKNGLYAVTSKLLDGEEGGASGVSVLQDGTMRGGGSIYYHTGKYTCSGGKWKGQVTTREHAPELITKLFARKVVTKGFTGTYTDERGEFEATALVGKRSVRLHVTFQLLVADGSDTN
jgi:T3SS negative regulator,GrlR